MAPHRRARSRVRSLRLLAAAAMLAAGLAIGPLDPATATPSQESSGELPVLWSGTLATGEGQPTSGEVTAFVRPSAAAIPNLGTGDAKGTGIVPIPVGQDAADADGRFELRARLPREQIPRRWLDQSGGVTVMLFAVSETGAWTVATDTVWYLDEPGSAPAWFSSNHHYESARQVARTPASATRTSIATDVAQADALDAAAGDRPTVLRTDQPAATAPAGGAQTAAVGPGSPYIGCSALGTVGTSSQFRTTDMVDMATYWRHRAEYAQSLSTSWEVGYSASGSSGWNVAGSVTFSSSNGQGVGKTFSSGNNAYFRETWRIGTNIKKIQWRCSTHSNPGPYYVYTAEAYGLNWQTQSVPSGDDVTCYDWSYWHSVGGYADYWREAGSSSSFWANAGVWGFYGGQKLTNGGHVRHAWWNDSQWNRHLCGESGPVAYGHSRVSAIDI